MKRDDIERRILLADSGELPEGEATKLEAALAADGEARKFRADTQRLARDTRRCLRVDGPGEHVMIRIRKEAAVAVAPKPLILRHPAASALVCAAALLIVVSGWLAFRTPRTALSPVDQVQTLVAMVMEEELPETGENASREAELKELAHQLLLMEGLHADESSTNLEDAFWELPPTALRGRSTRGFRAT